MRACVCVFCFNLLFLTVLGTVFSWQCVPKQVIGVVFLVNYCSVLGKRSLCVCCRNLDSFNVRLGNPGQGCVVWPALRGVLGSITS